jgi:hypothetical protein
LVLLLKFEAVAYCEAVDSWWFHFFFNCGWFFTGVIPVAVYCKVIAVIATM